MAQVKITSSVVTLSPRQTRGVAEFKEAKDYGFYGGFLYVNKNMVGKTLTITMDVMDKIAEKEKPEDKNGKVEIIKAGSKPATTKAETSLEDLLRQTIALQQADHAFLESLKAKLGK